MRRLMVFAVMVVGCAQPAAPGGTAGVGTMSWVVEHDASVVDVLADEPGVTRRLPVRAVFPAGERGATGGAFQGGAFPVLVFMHGTNGELDAHALLAQELASRGWVVLLAAHPGLARTADYPDAPSRGISPKLTALLAKANDGSTALADVFADPLMQASLELFRADLALIRDSATAHLEGLEVSRVAYGGHSLGAIATMRLCRAEGAACAAFVNLDGPPADLSTTDGVTTLSPKPVERPSLVIASELMLTGTASAPFWAQLTAQDELGSAPLLSLTLAKGGHLDLTDAPVALGHVAQGVLFGAGAAGSIDPIRAVDVTKQTVATFLERFGRCDANVELPGVLPPELVLRRARALERRCAP